nr:immunoglobulin heavy chain junction region [Mus musculus]MBK4188019.1 immunoglobulin heavy chain junction region [Mus musculus]MBK4188020.1 immunoglobulin heavy chain junction region [Mus musculus]
CARAVVPYYAMDYW